MKKIVLLLVILLSFAQAKILVSVSILPEKGIVEAIAKQKADIQVVVPKGASPHTFEPSPTTMIKLQKSAVYFAIGVELEKTWLEKFKSQNKNLLVVDLSKDIKLINNNPHIWLSVENLKLFAKKVYETFEKLDKQNQAFYEKNYHKYIKKLDSCKKDLTQQINTKSSKVFMTFHPAFTYFANEFNLTQIAIEINGKEPSLKEILKVIKKAKQLHIKTIIASPEFSDKSAKIIANELDAKVIKISPLDLDICKTMKKIVNSLI